MKQFYDTLFNRYGSQNWWPVTSKGLVPSYTGGPKNDRERFEVIIGAILAQNTSWKNVEKAIVNLNENGLVSVNGILNVELDKLKEFFPTITFVKNIRNVKFMCKSW